MSPLMKVLPTDKLPHGFQIGATVALGAGIFTLCWYLSNAGMLEIAATGLTYFIITLGRLSGTNLTKRVRGDFDDTAKIVETVRRDYVKWVSKRKLLSHAILAALATLLFIVCRFLASTVMTIIASPLLAIALGLGVTAFVISPVLFKGIVDSFKERVGTQPDAGEGQSAAHPEAPSH